jgi:RNA polymerase sigma-70 factor (ECF subfamily)
VVSLSQDPREPCGLTYAQLSNLSDDGVMAHLARGHGDAIAVLLDRYARLVESIAFRVVRDSTEAQDVAQEVFLGLCTTAARFDPAKGTTKMWVVRTAYRRSINRRRYLTLREAHSLDNGEEPPALPSAGDGWVAARLTAYESQRLVRQTLGRLDTAQRKVLELIFFDGLNMREAAEKTGTTIESVRHRYYRGLDKLRQCVGEGGAREALPRTQEVSDAGT